MAVGAGDRDLGRGRRPPERAGGAEARGQPHQAEQPTGSRGVDPHLGGRAAHREAGAVVRHREWRRLRLAGLRRNGPVDAERRAEAAAGAERPREDGAVEARAVERPSVRGHAGALHLAAVAGEGVHDASARGVPDDDRAVVARADRLERARTPDERVDPTRVRAAAGRHRPAAGVDEGDRARARAEGHRVPVRAHARRRDRGRLRRRQANGAHGPDRAGRAHQPGRDLAIADGDQAAAALREGDRPSSRIRQADGRARPVRAAEEVDVRGAVPAVRTQGGVAEGDHAAVRADRDRQRRVVGRAGDEARVERERAADAEARSVTYDEVRPRERPARRDQGVAAGREDRRQREPSLEDRRPHVAVRPRVEQVHPAVVGEHGQRPPVGRDGDRDRPDGQRQRERADGLRRAQHGGEERPVRLARRAQAHRLAGQEQGAVDARLRDGLGAELPCQRDRRLVLGRAPLHDRGDADDGRDDEQDADGEQRSTQAADRAALQRDLAFGVREARREEVALEGVQLPRVLGRPVQRRLEPAMT